MMHKSEMFIIIYFAHTFFRICRIRTLTLTLRIVEKCSLAKSRYPNEACNCLDLVTFKFDLCMISHVLNFSLLFSGNLLKE